MNKLFLMFGALAIALSISACNRQEEALARVGSRVITEEIFQTRLLETPVEYQIFASTEAGRMQFLDLLVREAVILEAARKAGIARRSDFRDAVAEFRREQERQLKEYETSLLIEIYLTQLQEREFVVTEREIRQHYEAHPHHYQTPVSVTARHILVQTEMEAHEILNQLGLGARFEDLAEDFSNDRVSARRGGEIGPFRRNELVPEFENVVFSMQAGEISDVVETPFGFHVIKKVSSAQLPPIPFEAAMPEIRRLLERAKFDAWFENIKRELGTTIYHDRLLSNIHLPYDNFRFHEGDFSP